MSEPQKVLRLAGSYYKLDHVSEEEFHNFISRDHAVKAAKIHERHGILHYQLVGIPVPWSESWRRHALTPTQALGSSQTRELAKGLQLPWKIDDHDVTIEFYFTNVSALLAVSADQDFKDLHVDTEKFIRRMRLPLRWRGLRCT
jgi:hypothetical protein